MENLNGHICSGLNAVNLKIVRQIEECHVEKGFFKPDMCHQVFGQSESIYGYKNLKIWIYYEASEFWCYVTSSFDVKNDTDSISGLQCEDYMKKLDPWLPKDCIINEDEFLRKILELNKPGPKGKLASVFCLPNGREFQVRVTDVDTVGYNEFHQRMETIIVWFIDAANFIDMEDKKWRFYILYEKVTKNNFEQFYFPVGYSTVYEYFAFPDRRRYRISQFIVFPPYQHLGLGTELLKAIYKHLKSIPNILDITVEDPSEKFQGIRDFVDVSLCRELSTFNSEALKCNFSKKMIEEAKEHFKLNEKQIRRVYEILRFSSVSADPVEYHLFKISVKQRLNIPYKKQEKKNKRQKLFHGAKSTICDKDHQNHHENILEKQYQKLILQYQLVLCRLQHRQLISKMLNMK